VDPTPKPVPGAAHLPIAIVFKPCLTPCGAICTTSLQAWTDEAANQSSMSRQRHGGTRLGLWEDVAVN